jgi:membrane protease YdiL (CAAX protease family)
VVRQWLRSKIARAPIAAAIVLFVAFEAVHLLFAWDDGRLLRAITGPVPDAWRGPLAWGIYAVLALVPVVALGWSRATGLTRPGRARAWPLVVVPLLAGSTFLLVGINLSADRVVPVLVAGTPLIALNEELFFRGLLLEILRPKGWRLAILGSSALFGLAHAANLLSGANVPFTILQVVATAAGGVAFAAIRIRAGSLWPLLVLHASLDAIALSSMTGAGIDGPMLMPAVFLWGGCNIALWWYGWRLLRGRSEAELTTLYGADRADVPMEAWPRAG